MRNLALADVLIAVVLLRWPFPARGVILFAAGVVLVVIYALI